MNLFNVLSETYDILFQGIQVTIEVTILSLLIAFVLGLVVSLLGFSKTPLRYINKVYVWLIRGTPIMVQVFYIYFAIPQLFQFLGDRKSVV